MTVTIATVTATWNTVIKTTQAHNDQRFVLKWLVLHHQYSRTGVRNRAFVLTHRPITYPLRPLWNDVIFPHAPPSVTIHPKHTISSSSWVSFTRLYHTNQESYMPLTTEQLELRIDEFERAFQSQHLHLTKTEFLHRSLYLLNECKSISSNTFPQKAGKIIKRKDKSLQQELLLRANMGGRILDLCLEAVESRRLFLWQWLKEDYETVLNSSNNDAIDRFSPSAYWSEAPHPTKEMYSLVFSMWKSVIESCSTFSIKSTNVMDLMESCARQSSSLLFLMEDEYTSDSAFIDAINSQIQAGRYTLLRTGAVLPDVRNYSDIIATWGQCIDGSILRLSSEKQDRGHQYNSSSRDGTFHKRLKLEATAMKSMMELLEAMEEDYYGTFRSDINTDCVERKRPPPDRYCYNIILAAMSRQINPSLYEMRLVVQRMMERVKYELEKLDNDPTLEEQSDTSQLYEFALLFFPDVYSYNALIEARANRAAMFALDTLQPQSCYPPPWPRYKSAWQQRSNHERRKRRFTASEEEAILAEQIVEEMCHLATVTVRPNIWSYNAVIKSWIKTDCDRGLQRAVLIANALAMNGRKRPNEDGRDPNGTLTQSQIEAPGRKSTIFERIANWTTSLMVSDDSKNESERSSLTKHTQNTGSASVAQPSSFEANDHRSSSQSAPVFQGVGLSNRLSYLSNISVKAKTRDRGAKHMVQSEMKPAQASNLPTLSSNTTISSRRPPNEKYCALDEPIGPLPYIEENVTPDLKTFVLVTQALESRGTPKTAKLANDLLLLLEEYYADLNTDIALYNSVLNAFAKAAKGTSDASLCMALAQNADNLLHRLIQKDQLKSDTKPCPNEYSFLMTINAWTNAATSAVSSGNISDGETAVFNAERLLKTLHTQSIQMNKSIIACYGAVIRTWASIGDAERAQRVLELLIEKSEGLPLDVIHFNAVFDVWARKLVNESDLDNAYSRLSSVFDLLLKMKRGGGSESYNVDPDTSSFNQVIRACYSPWGFAQSQNGESIRYKAFAIAYDCYRKMVEDYATSAQPDAHTYAHMLKAISCLLPSSATDNLPDKTALCRKIFHACCRGGHLTKSSVWTLRKTFPNENEFAALLLAEMDNHGGITQEKLLSIPEDCLFAYLPKDWSRNGRNFKSLNRHRH